MIKFNQAQMAFLQLVVDKKFKCDGQVISSGICCYLFHRGDDASWREFDSTLVPMFKTWRHYSGNPKFPVPNPRSFAITRSGKCKAAEKAYEGTKYDFDNFYGDNKYADLRRDLAKHLINEIKQRGLLL